MAMFASQNLDVKDDLLLIDSTPVNYPEAARGQTLRAPPSSGPRRKDEPGPALTPIRSDSRRALDLTCPRQSWPPGRNCRGRARLRG